MNKPTTLDETCLTRRGLTVDEFDLLHENGAFTECRRAELIDGDIYVTSPQWSRHAKAKTRLLMALTDRLASLDSELECILEVTVRVADDSAPEPDLVITSWDGDRFIPAEAVALAVEVSHSTLHYDLGRKRELYAAAGIAEYWVIDVNALRILVHSQPAGSAYARQHEVKFGDPLASVTIPRLVVETDHLVD